MAFWEERVDHQFSHQLQHYLKFDRLVYPKPPENDGAMLDDARLHPGVMQLQPLDELCRVVHKRGHPANTYSVSNKIMVRSWWGGGAESQSAELGGLSTQKRISHCDGCGGSIQAWRQ